MEERGTEPGACAQTGEDPGVGGRGWAGPRGARGGAAEAQQEGSRRRTRRDQEAAALRPSRGEWNGSGEVVREVPAPPSRRGLRLAVPSARGKREAPPL